MMFVSSLKRTGEEKVSMATSFCALSEVHSQGTLLLPSLINIHAISSFERERYFDKENTILRQFKMSFK